MAGSVIERVIIDIDDDGVIHYDDQSCTWERAEEIAGRKLDRRRSYAIIHGEVRWLIHWTDRCSGCEGSGCSECGHTGKSRQGWYAPLEAMDSDLY